MEIEELFGLPAHPLVVHAVVVLLPLAAAGTIAIALVRRWRGPYGMLVLGAAVAATLSVIVAEGSGEELEHDVPKSDLVDRHAELGDGVLPFAVGLTLVAAAVSLEPRWSRRRDGARPGAVGVVLVVLALGAGAASTWKVVQVGHSGAKAAWHDVDDRGGGDDHGGRGRDGGG
jgi:hypothetical protein